MSRSERERSSMKFIRFCILRVWRVDVVSRFFVSVPGFYFGADLDFCVEF